MSVAFEDRFDCVNIEYDSIFENLRTNWNNQINAILNSGVTGVDLPSRDDLEAIMEDNFFTTHSALASIKVLILPYTTMRYMYVDFLKIP